MQSILEAKVLVIRAVSIVASLYITFVSVDQVLAQSDSARAIELLNAAVDAHAQDWERLKISSGSGQIAWIGPDGESTWVCDAHFEISETKLWEQLVTLTASPKTSRKFDKVEFVADGDVIAAVSYSDRIKPSGCEVTVRADEESKVYNATSGSRIDLRKVLSPNFLRVSPVSNDLNAGATILLESNSAQGTETVVVRYPDSHRRYVLSSEWGWRLVKMELFAGKAEPSWVFDYKWRRMGNKIYPETITVQLDNVWGDGGGYHTHLVSFDELLEGNSRGSFSIESMDICGGARLIDHRPSTTTPVRTVVDTNSDASISEEIQEMPTRDRRPSAKSEIQPRSNFVLYLIISNVIALMLVAGFSVKKYRDSQSK